LHIAPKVTRGRSVSYEDLVALAQLCARQAKTATTQAAADELMRMAREYQRRAGEFAGGASSELEDNQTGRHSPSPSRSGESAQHVAQQQQQPQAKDDEG
jgi:hypothetical protein